MGAGEENSTASVGRRAIIGMAWAYGSYVGGRMLVLVSTAILARLLTPSEFGLVALALVFMVVLDTLRDLGLGQALIVASPEEEADRAQTVFGWSIVVGAVLTLVVSALGPLAAAFYDQPELVAILPVLGLNFLLRSLGSTHFALARKHLDFRARTIAEMSDVVTRGALGIGLALAGAGVWSLVLGYVVGTAARSAALWLCVDFRPRLAFSRTHLRDLLTFGGLLTIVDIEASITANIDKLLIGRLLTPAALGLYAIGFRLPELLVMNLAVVLGEVLFPAYAAIDRRHLREAALVSLRYISLVVLPIGAGLVVMAEPVILGLFGDQWEESITVMQIMVLFSIGAVLNMPSGTVLKVIRKAHVQALLMLPQIVLLVVGLLLFADEGIVVAAIVVSVIEFVFNLLQLTIASRMLDLPLRRIAATLVGPVVAAGAVAGALAPVRMLVDSPWPALLAGVVVGTAAYVAAVRVVAPDALERVRAMRAQRGGGGRGPTAAAPLAEGGA